MGQALIGYAVFMMELFILFTAMASVETALWAFGAVHIGCAVGVSGCVWWERRSHAMVGVEGG